MQTRQRLERMMKLMKLQLSGKKRLLIVLVMVVLVALTGFSFWGRGANAAEYMTARAERGNLRNTVTATGTLQAVTTVQVGSQASGTISALYADFNSTVRRGQVIAQLDPATTQAQIGQSRANLEQARAGLAQARASLVSARAGVSDAQAKGLAARSTASGQQAGVSSAEANLAVLKAQMDDAASVLRQEESLLKGGIVSQREYETAQTNYRTAEARYNQAMAQVRLAVVTEQSSSSAGIAQSQAQIEQAQAQVGQAQAQVQNAEAQVQQAEAALRLAEINLSHTTITSPIDGVVVSRNVDVGQTVAASLSAPTLFTIAQDLTQMQVIANIDQADIGLVEGAKGVNFTVDAFPGQECTGTIQQIRLNPQNTQNVVTYNVVIDVANPEQKLKPGMTANLTITIDERANVVKVPNAALRFTPQLSAGQSSQNRTGSAVAQNSRRGATRTGNAGNTNNTAGEGGARAGSAGEGQKVTPPTSPVLEGQTRRVWVMGQDGVPQPRRITVGLTDGASTEVISGDLREGEVLITGQNISGASGSQNNSQAAPGFGGAPRGGMGGGGRQ